MKIFKVRSISVLSLFLSVHPSQTGESWLGLYDVLHPSLEEFSEEMEKRRAAEKAREAAVPCESENAPPSYDEVMGNDLAFSFYFPEVSRVALFGVVIGWSVL